MKNLQFVTATLSAFPQAAPAYSRGKIVITRDMIVNESGLDDPFKLFDQSDYYNEGGTINAPTTEGWIPSYTPGDYPLSFYVDLGHAYQFDTCYLFDGNGTGSITVSTGEPGYWNPAFTDGLQSYEQWNKWDLTATSRYVRITYDQYNDARGVRELVFYGTRSS